MSRMKDLAYDLEVIGKLQIAIEIGSLVYECAEYRLHANETGILVITKDRKKWQRLAHFLDYEIELENEIADLKRQLNEWEEKHASSTIGKVSSESMGEGHF